MSHGNTPRQLAAHCPVFRSNWAMPQELMNGHSWENIFDGGIGHFFLVGYRHVQTSGQYLEELFNTWSAMRSSIGAPPSRTLHEAQTILWRAPRARQSHPPCASCAPETTLCASCPAPPSPDTPCALCTPTPLHHMRANPQPVPKLGKGNSACPVPKLEISVLLDTNAPIWELGRGVLPTVFFFFQNPGSIPGMWGSPGDRNPQFGNQKVRSVVDVG